MAPRGLGSNLVFEPVSPTSESQLGWVPESELQGRLKHSRAAG